MAGLLSGDVSLGFTICAFHHFLVIFTVLYRVVGGLSIALVRYVILPLISTSELATFHRTGLYV